MGSKVTRNFERGGQALLIIARAGEEREMCERNPSGDQCVGSSGRLHVKELSQAGSTYIKSYMQWGGGGRHGKSPKNFAELKDSRVKRNREHLLAEILLIAIAMKRVWIMDISIWYRIGAELQSADIHHPSWFE